MKKFVDYLEAARKVAKVPNLDELRIEAENAFDSSTNSVTLRDLKSFNSVGLLFGLDFKKDQDFLQVQNMKNFKIKLREAIKNSTNKDHLQQFIDEIEK